MAGSNAPGAFLVLSYNGAARKASAGRFMIPLMTPRQ